MTTTLETAQQQIKTYVDEQRRVCLGFDAADTKLMTCLAILNFHWHASMKCRKLIYSLLSLSFSGFCPAMANITRIGPVV